MEVHVRSHNEISIVDVSGELDLYNAFRLRDTVTSLVDSGCPCFIVNLRAVRYIDSSGIGALLAINSLLVKSKRQIRIVNIPQQVQRVIDLTRLTDFLPLLPTELDGIESIESERHPKTVAERHRTSRGAHGA
ncbi:MAG TPA: STAS domain-containing protein [Spirochaetia bacterium]